MSDYKNSKITNKVTIVERITSDPINQAFVVLEGSKSSLETAHNWAEGWQGNKRVDHTYINGRFKLEIQSAAQNSYQSGKLSFWNCIITAPDDKQFLIGINSEALCQLILSSTFVNGKCQDENLYLGKIANQTAAISKSSPLYEQAMKDEAQRQRVKTANYKVGDIVTDLHNNKMVYAGEAYRLFTYDRNRDYAFTVFPGAEKVHLYLNLNNYGQPYDWPTIQASKTAKLVEGHYDKPIDALKSLKAVLNAHLNSNFDIYKKWGSRLYEAVNVTSNLLQLEQYSATKETNIQEIIDRISAKAKELGIKQDVEITINK